MTFASPYLLFGLIAVPLAAIGYRILEGRRTRRAAPWSRQAMLPNIVRRPERKLTYAPEALFLIGLTFLLVGFARPQRVHSNALPQAPTVVLAVDVSGSMDATDVAPTRLRAARAVAVQFLHELPAEIPGRAPHLRNQGATRRPADLQSRDRAHEAAEGNHAAGRNRDRRRHQPFGRGDHRRCGPERARQPRPARSDPGALGRRTDGRWNDAAGGRSVRTRRLHPRRHGRLRDAEGSRHPAGQAERPRDLDPGPGPGPADDALQLVSHADRRDVLRRAMRRRALLRSWRRSTATCARISRPATERAS